MPVDSFYLQDLIFIHIYIYSSIRAVSQQKGVHVPTYRQTEPDDQQRRQQERPGDSVAGDRRGRMDGI